MATSAQRQLAREAAERYERILVPAILGPFAEALVDWTSIVEGEVVLDVGCGTGTAARRASEYTGASGRVNGIDANPGMIAVARSIAVSEETAIEWQEASADHLPHPDASVDVVLCAQTLQFLENRSRALAEMHRVLKPGGRVSVSLWCEIQQNPYFDVLAAAITSHIGDETASGLGATFGLTDHDEILALLVGAGFERVEISTTLLELDLPPMEDFVPLHISATAVAAGYKAAPEDRRRAVVQEIISRFDSFQVDDRNHRVPFSSYFARGYKV